jgi:hypothetical protein
MTLFRVLPLLLTGCPAPDDSAASLAGFTAVTFNTGTTENSVPDDEPNGGYTPEQATISDTYYGDGLAFEAVVADTRAWFEAVQADVVVFQEIFYSGLCPEVPAEAREGFVCETWQEGDPTVAQEVLGEGWQVACHPGKDDKCAAVRRSFGSFEGLADDFHLEGLDGATIDGCGSGARVGRGIIELVDGGEITLVNVHGSSGISSEDRACREAQFRQVFEDLGLGDGEPAANGAVNLVMGDFNTDPGRAVEYDQSAAYLASAVEGSAFAFLSEVGGDAEPSYQGLANIDHVISDGLVGTCVVPGVTGGEPGVSEIVFFDHHPVVCQVQAAGGAMR